MLQLNLGLLNTKNPCLKIKQGFDGIIKNDLLYYQFSYILL